MDFASLAFGSGVKSLSLIVSFWPARILGTLCNPFQVTLSSAGTWYCFEIFEIVFCQITWQKHLFFQTICWKEFLNGRWEKVSGHKRS